jgi:YbbR domain-containing protein
VKKKLNIFIASIIFSFLLWGSISLSDYYYTNVDVKLSLVNFPKNYTTGSKLPDKVTLKVKGQGWKLVSFNVGSDADFKVSVNHDSGKKVISVYNYLESNRWLLSDVDIISIHPDTLSFYVEKIITRKLPVIPDLDLDYKPGYGLAQDIIVKPDSVIVHGPTSILKTIKGVKTEKMSFTPLDSKTDASIQLASMRGFSFNTDLINLTLDVQKIVDKNFENIPIEVLDVPPGKEVLLIPNKIGINARGGIEVLGRLKENQFRAFIHYRDVVMDTTGSVTAFIDKPRNVIIQFLKPERLRYIIKSF